MVISYKPVGSLKDKHKLIFSCFGFIYSLQKNTLEEINNLGKNINQKIPIVFSIHNSQENRYVKSQIEKYSFSNLECIFYWLEEQSTLNLAKQISLKFNFVDQNYTINRLLSKFLAATDSSWQAYNNVRKVVRNRFQNKDISEYDLFTFRPDVDFTGLSDKFVPNLYSVIKFTNKNSSFELLSTVRSPTDFLFSTYITEESIEEKVLFGYIGAYSVIFPNREKFISNLFNYLNSLILNHPVESYDEYWEELYYRKKGPVAIPYLYKYSIDSSNRKVLLRQSEKLFSTSRFTKDQTFASPTTVISSTKIHYDYTNVKSKIEDSSNYYINPNNIL